MALNVTQKLLKDHLVEGDMTPGEEIALKIDHTLTQDATGTMVMLEFEAMKVPRVKTELSAQYVDHNLLQQDFRNPDDHLFLNTAAKRYGLWFSPPGNGVSHPLHMEQLGKPGKTMLGSDSHTCAAGSLGMFALGAGGLEVAMAMAGRPFYVRMPKVVGVKVTGELPDWVSAKDVILEMLRRHGTKGGAGRVFEYYGPGLQQLTAMDRHVIANMGQEMGHTATVFPADEAVEEFLRLQDRAEDYVELVADEGADYDELEEIDLSELVPLIAKPSSPGNVVPVSEVAGESIYQAYVGSSANPGLRDFGIAANIVDGRRIHDQVSFDINPTSRQIFENMIETGALTKLVHAGARIHQTGCNGCIGMGQAPATGRNSLRTVPRNFPGRSGTKEDSVFLCSPETAAASALTGEITDPRSLDFDYPRFQPPERPKVTRTMLRPPVEGEPVEVQKGPNIKDLPIFDPLPDELDVTVLLKLGDDISTDEILPGGTQVLPFRSNVPAISEFVFYQVDESFYDRAKELEGQGFAVVGGENYGQGSSREHAALAPRYLGLRVVLAKGYSRIHWSNLANFGVVPLRFSNPDDWDRIEQNDRLTIRNLRDGVKKGEMEVRNETKDETYKMVHDMSERQVRSVLMGGLVNVVRQEQEQQG